MYRFDVLIRVPWCEHWIDVNTVMRLTTRVHMNHLHDEFADAHDCFYRCAPSCLLQNTCD